MLEDGAAHHLDIDRIQAALKATIESQAATIDSQAETMESMKELTDNDKRRNDRQNLVQEKKDRFKLLVSSAELAIILLFGGGQLLLSPSTGHVVLIVFQMLFVADVMVSQLVQIPWRYGPSAMARRYGPERYGPEPPPGATLYVPTDGGPGVALVGPAPPDGDL